MHALSAFPQVRGVRSRIFVSMRSFERFDKSTSTSPSSGSRRRRNPVRRRATVPRPLFDRRRLSSPLPLDRRGYNDLSAALWLLATI